HTGAGHYVYKSTNYGVTWGSAILATSGGDRNTLAADQTAGPYSNYIYSAITPGGFSRSTDIGATWTQTYFASNNIPGVMIAVGPNGNTQGGCVIYVTNTGATQNVTYSFHRSLDGGATFTTMSSINVAGYVGTLNGAGRLVINNARTRPYPMIAMDNSYSPYRGRLYLVYASNEPPGDGNKPDIKLQYSSDQGATWSSWVRVNDNSSPEQSDQWYPAVWCDKETGRLYIKWYDTRNNPATYGVDVYATYTTNGGASFALNQRVTTATWNYPHVPCPPNDNCYRGDYDGIVSNSFTSFSIWYDGRRGFYENMGAYFPDFAMKVNPLLAALNGINDSAFFFASVPSVKLYTDKAKFTASVTPSPSSGTITMTFLNRTTGAIQDSLTSYPDSLRFRVKTSGGVTAGAYTITVTGKGTNGTPLHRRNITLTVAPIGIHSNSNEIPKDYYLYQNYPNPFNPATYIRFDIPKAGFVKLTVYDISGKEVSVLVFQNLQAGKHTVDFSGDNLSSGIYFYKIETQDFTSIRKMIVLK
ncbi:MAG: T9SS type A sorting domain-containing protein, partial [Ignavibacteria bacterium]